MEKMIQCSKCSKQVNSLAIFPNDFCLDCYSVSAEGQRMWTAEELVSFWSGK